jgi:hypothetical protein
MMQIDALVQWDEYRMPSDKKFLDEQEAGGDEYGAEGGSLY